MFIDGDKSNKLIGDHVLNEIILLYTLPKSPWIGVVCQISLQSNMEFCLA